MPEPTTPPEGQAPEGSTPTPQAGSTSTPVVPEAGQEPKTFDADYVKTLRAEAAAHRKEANELKAKVKSFEDSQLSASEKLQKQADEAAKRATDLESALRKERSSNLLARAAAKAGLAADDAERFLSVEFDSDGNVTTDVEKAIAELVKAKPYLVQSSASSSAANGAARRTNSGSLEEQSAALLSPKSKKFWGL